MDLRACGKHAAWGWGDSHHAFGYFLSGWLLRRRERSILFRFVCVFAVFDCFYLSFFGKRWLILLIMSPSLPPSLSPTSLHPHSGNLRTRVWIYARVLPLQDLCGYWICGFRYDWNDFYFNLNCTVKVVKEACQTGVILHITEGT